MKGHKLLANKSHSEQIAPEDLVFLIPVCIARKAALMLRMEIPNLLSETDMRNQEPAQPVNNKHEPTTWFLGQCLLDLYRGRIINQLRFIPLLTYNKKNNK